jgi:hypothetical protein
LLSMRSRQLRSDGLAVEIERNRSVHVCPICNDMRFL